LNKERHESVVDIILGELEMVTFNADELNFLLVHEGLETNVIVDVEVAFLERLNSTSFG
jgi:hypothetical protein